MVIDDDSSDASSVDSLVLDLAAHPLSSVNPPPCDLPDLLDRLIASEAELRRKWLVCDQLVNKLMKRIPNIKQRLEELRQGHPQYRTSVARLKQNCKSKQRMCFEACEELYQRMFMQTSFMHFCLNRKTKVHIQQHMKAHKDIFDALLGDRHDHRGIEVASSRHLQCTPGCNWYVEHGPYEWTKRPYTSQWWEEMNDTDWDWVRMRQHITDVLANARGKAIVVANIFLSNAQIYVPFWFWYEKYETWSPWIQVLPVQNEDSVAEEKVVCQIRFEKTKAIIEEERLRKLEQLRQDRGEEEDTAGAGTLDDTVVEVDAVGKQEIDPAVVFDGDAYLPDFNNRTQPTSIGSWLDWWGYQKWSDSYNSTTQGHLLH